MFQRYFGLAITWQYCLYLCITHFCSYHKVMFCICIICYVRCRR